MIYLELAIVTDPVNIIPLKVYKGAEKRVYGLLRYGFVMGRGLNGGGMHTDVRATIGCGIVSFVPWPLFLPDLQLKPKPP
jgi:hypothetical protein